MNTTIVHSALRVVAPRLFWRVRARRWGVLDADAELAIIPSLCRREMAAFDVGANDGIYAIQMIGYSRCCYAFEPREEQANSLRRTFLRSRPPVYVEPVAISDYSGTAEFRVCPSQPTRSTMELANGLDTYGDVRVARVPVKRLDEYSHERVACLKIDVEGHEEAVLRGGTQILQRDRPSIVIEIEQQHNPGCHIRIPQFLSALGYQAYFLEGKRLIRFEGAAPQHLHNFIFVHPNRKHQIANWL